MAGDPDNRKTFGPLLRRIKALPEAAMRREVLIAHLGDLDPATALALLEELLAGAARRSPRHLLTLEALHDAILQGRGAGPFYEVLSATYSLAREQDAEGVVHLLLSTRPQRGPVLPDQLHGDQELSQRPLGERKFLARGHDRQRLERLLIDPDPNVIHNLLRNPGLTELEVIQLAARRPTRVEIQREILASRFGTRYRIRVALVRNPYTPTELSLKLLSHLLRRELKAVGQDSNLHPLVRKEARRLVAERRARPRKPKAEAAGA